MALLNVSQIGKREEEQIVLEEISFQQDAGCRMAIAGASGAGKTTLLKVIAGFVQPDNGQVFLNGEKVAGPFDKLVPGHPRIAYLSQHFELRNNYRVEEILRYANELPGSDAMDLYRICRIDHLLKRWTHQVSGGEKQRIALARLLTTSPQLLLLDEPYSNLDPMLKNILKEVVEDLAEQLKITCLLTSHDPNDTLSWAQQILVMDKGRIIQQSSPRNIYRYPVNEYVAGLFGAYKPVTTTMHSAFPTLAETIKFLRPEDFIISGAAGHGTKGFVASVRYMGKYDEIEVILQEDIRVIVIHPSHEIHKGQEVFLSLRPNAFL